MINKIKLFFIALNEAYLNITKEHREAKETIAIVESMVIEYQQYLERIKRIYTDLSKLYTQFPKSQRIIYIQQTMDLLNYGFYYKQFKNDRNENIIECINLKDKYRIGYTDRYDYFVQNLVSTLKDMKENYKGHNYKKVMEEYNTFKMTIDNFNKKYINDIEDSTKKQ